MTTRHVAVLAVLAVGCGFGGGGHSDPQARTGVRQAAIRVAGNDVSCHSPASKAFAAGLCVCEDLRLVGQGLTVLCKEGNGVDVGVNGVTHVVGEYDISGSLVSWKGVSDVGELNVTQNVETPANVSGVGTLKVGKDLSVGGDFSSVGEVSIGGLLRAAGKVSAIGAVGGFQRGDYVARTAPPCGCGADQLIDVKAEVERAAATNDNAKLSLDPKNIGDRTLTLEGGRFFLDGVQQIGKLSLVVTKPSALFIRGDLTTVGTDTIDVAEGASLDLYVSGNIENVGDWSVGEGTLAGTVRLFIGGDNASLSSVGNADIVGSLYAPTAAVNLVGDTNVRGALFAKNIDGVGRLLVDYAKPPEPALEECP